MDRTNLIAELHASRLVAVVRSKSAGRSARSGKCRRGRRYQICRDHFQRSGRAGCHQRTGAAPRLHVGAGTVLAPQQAERAIGAGAEFVVSPSLELNLIGLCHTANIACFPGAATATEIIAAQRAHADLIKIFPADFAGGPYFIRQMQGPFPEVASWCRAASI